MSVVYVAIIGLLPTYRAHNKLVVQANVSLDIRLVRVVESL